MLTLNVSDSLTLELYDSMDTLPAVVYQYAKQYEILDAEAGGGEHRLKQGLAMLAEYAKAGQMESFAELQNNILVGRFLTLNRMQPMQMEFVCYVKAANGVPVKDLEEDNIMSLLSDWSEKGLTQTLIAQTLDDVKKNSVLK